MYRCYCKILKRLNELEREVQSEDRTLLESVQNIKNELNENTQHDIEQQEQIDNLEVGMAQTINMDDIQSLFNRP